VDATFSARAKRSNVAQISIRLENGTMSIDLPEAAASIDAFSNNIATLCVVLENLEKLTDNDSVQKPAEATRKKLLDLTKSAGALQIMIVEEINKQTNLVRVFSDELSEVFAAMLRLEAGLSRANELFAKHNQRQTLAQKKPDDITSKLDRYMRSAGLI
jgi:hypothetical protein